MEKLWEKILAVEKFKKKNTLPDTPGVYFFLGAKKEFLYIGKAASLRDRVKSYFSRDVLETRGPKIANMLERIYFVAYRKTDSVLEALILETNLIKQYQPPHNTDAKDDKSWNYVVITKEKFPRVLLMRGKELAVLAMAKKTIEIKDAFGPFTSGGALREALKITRKIFPWRDKCVPYEEWLAKQKTKMNSKRNKQSGLARECFSAQIGLCPGVCAGKISAREYRRIINHIRMFFEGRKNQLMKKLESEMKRYAKHLEFEKADEIKKTLFALKHIQDVALIKDELRMANSGLREIKIEAYDVAHLGGEASVGVMVAVENGQPAKDFYKKFILRKKHNGNDLTALQEILSRRFKHTEWPFPDIIVVDGAELQVEVAEKILSDSGLAIPIIGVAKDAKHKPERLIGKKSLVELFEKDILFANSEAHRFAITFHRRRREKEFL